MVPGQGGAAGLGDLKGGGSGRMPGGGIKLR
jgi:hypothetical protein